MINNAITNINTLMEHDIQLQLKLEQHGQWMKETDQWRNDIGIRMDDQERASKNSTSLAVYLAEKDAEKDVLEKNYEPAVETLSKLMQCEKSEKLLLKR